MTALAGFGALMLAGAALLAILGGDPVELALQGGAGAAALAGAVVVGARERRTRARGVPRRSGPTVLLAVGVGLMAFGAEVGQWLLLIGAGLAVTGLGGLAAERGRG